MVRIQVFFSRRSPDHFVRMSRAAIASHATAQQDYGVSVSRVHRDYNLERSREYWDYENITISWGRHENYVVTGKLGEGKFSEVFRGRHVRSRRRCVVKVLKPIRPKKIKREICILQNLSGGPNIIQLLDLVRDPYSGTPSLVFEYVDNVEFRTLYPALSPLDVRFFMFQLLRALSHCHAHGIMHRDIKPHNIMIDPRKRELRLIDWGLAEFYFPGQEYHVRVASRYFKGPELLVGLRCYDFSLDMWSFGCTFAAIVLRREPLFRGRDNQDQLRKVAEVLGSKDLRFYLQRHRVPDQSWVQKITREVRHEAVPWEELRDDAQRIQEGLGADANWVADDEALDLVRRVLIYEHSKRLTADEAMAHPYFDSVRPAAAAGDDAGAAAAKVGRPMSGGASKRGGASHRK